MVLETWRPISFGYVYQISSYGLVRNLRTGKFLAGWINKSGYRLVTLSNDGEKKTFYIHHLVAEAFIGDRRPGEDVRHLDGNALNNNLDNLLYGTRSENILDSVLHGTHFQARKTHCLQGHEYTEENTYVYPSGKKDCRKCRAESSRKYKLGLKSQAKR